MSDSHKKSTPKNLDYRDIIKSKPERLNEKIRISQRDIEIIDEQGSILKKSRIEK